ncbi:MmyB family transcriptional regulator [Streptomyces goshikiensis]
MAGPRGELVLANAAFEVLTEGAAAHLLEPPVNVLRLALHPEGMGPRVANLAAWGRHITESLRAGGELRLLTTLTSFATAVDVTLAELRLEAFLPADPETAELLRRRAAARDATPPG